MTYREPRTSTAIKAGCQRLGVHRNSIPSLRASDSTLGQHARFSLPTAGILSEEASGTLRAPASLCGCVCCAQQPAMHCVPCSCRVQAPAGETAVIQLMKVAASHLAAVFAASWHRNSGSHKHRCAQERNFAAAGHAPQVCRPGSREQWAGKLYRQQAAVPAGCSPFISPADLRSAARLKLQSFRRSRTGKLVKDIFRSPFI